ncbi:MAG: CocE/NonD family hydrolase [Betaproteobacteria bacterium]|nr:CocE/NonD family hydrolase [Betaproteobacteria bacterium]NBY72261.1 CocE/NonD family hydrolase [Betaproteobacteria bacterium]NDD12052.1 CocE/NonD family hydrolase [Betaproteobacteria bacterium]
MNILVEQKDNMHIEWDVSIPLPDGITLRADIFRPIGDGQYPAILTYGPYAKGLAFQVGYKTAWTRMISAYPEIAQGTSNKYQSWELVDPEKWVPDGYACVRIDSRGAGCSEGFLDVWSALEAQDQYECIEWTAVQPWCNGKVGLNGISYYAMNQWQTSALQPPHLSAMCAWEGASDYYRELCRHGGILSDFLDGWYLRQVKSVQYGVGDRAHVNPNTGRSVAGAITLSDEELAKRRAETHLDAQNHEMLDEFYKPRIPDYSKIKTPLLSAANWGGIGLHPRGNFEGYLQSASESKWLEVHGDTHFSHFYSNYGLNLQKKFFGYFLKGESNGWNETPRVQLNIRHPGEKFVLRGENEWPLARTQWTPYFLQPDGQSLSTVKPEVGHTLPYHTRSEGLQFSTGPLEQALEITGPMAARLRISSQTTDADVFLAIRVFDPDGKEVSFIGSNDPRTPVGLGWLRASHRKTDSSKSLPYRPWHTHDEKQPLVPGQPVDLEVEIWPTCIVIPAGYRLDFNLRGKDYRYDDVGVILPYDTQPMYGVGPFTHENPLDRPEEIFHTVNTLHWEPDASPYVLLPIIPN